MGHFTPLICVDRVMKGDWVEIVVDAGDSVRTYDVTATRAGRRVETRVGRGVAEVTEVTRSGTVVRTARFMSNRVLALVEHPASRSPLDEEREEREPAAPRRLQAADGEPSG